MKNLQKFIIIIFFLNLNFNLCFSQNKKCDPDWQCDNGDCIARDELCDGHRDCSDGSDEVIGKCLQIQCPKYSFQCSYGACVGGSALCNNHKDCDDNSDEAPSICRIEGNDGNDGSDKYRCGDDSFKCDNGVCISIDLACDGKADCTDSSDETTQLCTAYYCPAFAFRCGYGACINGEKICNNVNDCLDGSDESFNLCNGYRPITTKPPPIYITSTDKYNVSPQTDGCRVTYRNNLITKLEGENPVKILPGDYVGDYESVKYSCEERHVLIGSKINYCNVNKWSENIPICKKYCSHSVLSSITIQPTCTLNGTTVSCRLPISPGTHAFIACALGYQKIIPSAFDNLYCNENGEWDYEPYRCQQVCGEEDPDLNVFISGGTKTNNTKVPWNVAIYSNLEEPNQQICGGTIISARLVVSAAHCFWNGTTSKLNDIALYKIGAGKYFRDFYAVETLSVQFSDIAEIHISKKYKDHELSYVDDIAILVLKTYLHFAFHIKPACISWESYSEQSISSNLIGRVGGWGKNKSGLPSKELNTIELKTLSFKDCVDKLEVKYKNYVTGDKFCVSSKDGQTVCKGDSGAGFLVPKEDKYSGVLKFNLQGIVSNGINTNEQCTGDFLTAYTNIQFFKEMIQTYIDNFKAE